MPRRVAPVDLDMDGLDGPVDGLGGLVHECFLFFLIHFRRRALCPHVKILIFCRRALCLPP